MTEENEKEIDQEEDSSHCFSAFWERGRNWITLTNQRHVFPGEPSGFVWIRAELKV